MEIKKTKIYKYVITYKLAIFKFSDEIRRGILASMTYLTDVTYYRKIWKKSCICLNQNRLDKLIGKKL